MKIPILAPVLAVVLGGGFVAEGRAATLAYWNFDDTSPEANTVVEVADVSANKIALHSVSSMAPASSSPSIPSSPPGPSGNRRSLEFATRSRAGLTAGNAAKLNFGHGAPFTVECWINPRSYPAMAEKVQRVIVQKRGGDKTSKVFPGYNLTLNGDGKAFFRAEGTEGGGKTAMTSGIIPLNEWTHVAVSRDTAGRFKVYVNGKLDNAVGGPPFAGSLENEGDFVIGYNRLARGQDFFFDGLVDEVRISDTDLKPDELLCK